MIITGVTGQQYATLDEFVKKAPVVAAQRSVLEEAQEVIYGDREQTYGRPDKNLKVIATLWEVYVTQKYGLIVKYTPEDVCWMMALLKMARQMNTGKRDNLVDAAGYIALIERLTKEQHEETNEGENRA